MSDLRENLKTEFQEPEYRYGYAESFLNTKLATQIKTLREEREKTQAEAAALMGIKQPGYRRFEDVNHSVWKTDTLWNIARAYGVRLDISFKTFGSLLDDKERFNKEDLKVKAFKDDPAFKEPAAKEPEPEEVLVEAVGNPVVFPLPITGLGLGIVDQEGIRQVRAAAMNLDWLIDYLRGGPNTESPGLGAVHNPPPQPPPPQRIPDRYNGFPLVPARQGAVPRQQQGPELNRGAIVPHPCGSREGNGVIGTSRKLPLRLRPRDSQRKKRA